MKIITHKNGSIMIKDFEGQEVNFKTPKGELFTVTYDPVSTPINAGGRLTSPVSDIPNPKRIIDSRNSSKKIFNLSKALLKDWICEQNILYGEDRKPWAIFVTGVMHLDYKQNIGAFITYNNPNYLTAVPGNVRKTVLQIFSEQMSLLSNQSKEL